MNGWPLGGVLIAILLQLARYHVTGTHFRGVHMWWDSIDGKRFVNIYYRVAWKRDWRDETYCDMVTISSGRLIGPPAAGYTKCTGCEERETIVGDMLFRCTDYSGPENWSAGVGNHTYNFPFDGRFIIKWQGRGWLDGVHEGYDAPWSTVMIVDVRARRDTGMSNNSPRTVVPPIIHLQHGCTHTIKLPVIDPDGDVIRCRWATVTGEYDECGGICGSFQGADLNEETCTLRYTANKEVGYFAVAVQIEDYIPESAPFISNVNSLSSVPLQFLVLVYQTIPGIDCDSKPELIDPTPKEDTCITVKPNDLLKLKLVARSKNEFTGFREIQTVSLIGMNKSEVSYYNNSPATYYVNVTWIPTESQLGQHLFCFSAIDGYNISSDQRCVYIVVTKDEAPELRTFDYDISSHLVTITFDQRIKRPLESRYIYVYSEASKVPVITIDTSKDDVVDISNNSLSFGLSEDITSTKAQLYLLLDPGIVQALSYTRCGMDSAEIKEPDTLILQTNVTGMWSNTIITLETSITLTPFTGGYLDPASSSGQSSKNYTWLIVAIVILLVLFALAVLAAVVIYRKKAKNKYSRKERQEQYTRSIASKVASNGAYEPDFNDIDVKFR